MKRFLATSILAGCLFLGCSATAIAAPKTMPDGTVFDAEFYANTYPDVKAAFGNDETALYNHYVQHGKAEGRKATASSTATTASTAYQDNFDPVFYANTYPDVKAAFGNDTAALYNHYLNNGKKEGRICNASQQTNQKKTNSEAASVAFTPISEEAKAFELYTYRAWLKTAINHGFYYTEDTDQAHFDTYWRCIILHVNLNDRAQMINRNRNLVDFFEKELFGKGYCLNHLEEAREYGWVSPDFTV